MTLKDAGAKSRFRLISFLLLSILIITLFSGCSQVSEDQFVDNSSVNNLLERTDNSSLPTRHEVMDELSELKENPENLSIGSLFGFDGFEGYSVINLTRSLRP